MGIALKADIDDYSKAMATSSDATDALGASIRGVTRFVRNLGAAMTVGAAAAGAGMFLLAQRAEAVSEKFREVRSISTEVSDVQGEYGDLVSDLNTEFGLQVDRLEVIEGLYQSVSAGVKEGAEAQREFLSTAARLAVVGRTELATTVDVISTAMNAYGKGTEFAERASEALFRTVQFGKVKLEELAPVMGRITALGSDLGVNIEELGAAMSVLTRTGFEARVAATGVRAVLRSLMKPSENMQKALRDIAVQQDFFADSMEKNGDKVRELANKYRNATSAIKKLEEAQAAARRKQEKASLAIQEARLKMTAIEEERLDQLPKLTTEAVKNADSVKELKSVISDYRFQVNKARIAEEKSRQQKEKKKEKINEVKESYKGIEGAQGNLSKGIGMLIGKNMGLIETLDKLQNVSDKQNISMSKLIPRTRGLQAALALTGNDTEELISVFQKMRKDGVEPTNEELKRVADTLGITQEKAKGLAEKGGDLSTLYKEQVGPAQKLRNSVAKLKESMTDLGKIFRKDAFEAIGNLANKVDSFVNKIRNMRENVRKGISRFAMLAVAIGLVLGPLLLFGGQLALIIGTMGSAFIPFMLLAGVALGGLASAMWRVLNPAEEMKQKMAETGEMAMMPGGDQLTESQKLLKSMRDTLASVIGIVKRMKQIFVEETLPGMIHAGRAFFNVINEVSDQMSGFMGEEDITPLRKMGILLGEAFKRVGDFLNANKELIASLAVMAVDTLANRVIPNLKDFVIGIKDVLMNVNPKPFIVFAYGLLQVALAFTDLLGWLGRFMTEHQKFLGMMVTAAGVGLMFVGVLLKIVRALAPFIKLLRYVVPILSAAFTVFVAWIGPLSTSTYLMAALSGWLASAIPYFGYLAAAAKIVTAAIGGLAAALGLPVWATVLLIAALVGLVAALWYFRDEVWSALMSVEDVFTDVFGILQDMIAGEFGWRTAGQKISERISKGIKDGASKVINAIRGVVDAASDYLPSSPAEKGPLSKKPPKKSGKAISTDFAKGIESNMGKVEGAMGNIPTTPENGNFDVGGKGFGGGTKKEINISEKAIYFAEGAFQGVAEEKMPEKVRDEVEIVLEEDIVEKVEGKGGAKPTRR